MIIQPTGWLIDLVRSLLAGIDELLFKLLTFIIKLIFDIATFNLSNSETLTAVYTKLYVVLTVYMLFKLSFTFLNYIVNPEALSDEKQGVKKIIRNAVIMIILLITLPGIFSGKILGNGTDNVISRIQKAATPLLSKILATSPEKAEDDSQTAAEAMALTIARIFYHPSYKAYGYVCGQDENDLPINPITSIGDISNTVKDNCKKKYHKDEYKEKTFYNYTYIYLVSTAVTCIMIYMLVKMAFLVGKRTFKLLVLEIIFPIPVIMLIDPKALDDSGSPFKVWLHNFVSTFLELYFQLGVLYLLLNIINLLINAFDNFGNKFDDLLLELALIISLVYFAGEAPVFVKKALGVKKEDEPSDDMGAVVLGAASFALTTAQEVPKKAVVGGAKTVGSTLASGIASARHGGSFSDGAHAGFKRSIGYDSNKGYRENFKDKLKETKVGGAFYKARTAANNRRAAAAGAGTGTGGAAAGGAAASTGGSTGTGSISP